MKIRNIFRWIITLIQIVLVVATIIIYRLSESKMGVMRSLTYKNEIFDRSFLKIKVIYSLIFILISLLLLAVRYYKRSSKFKNCLAIIVFDIIVAIFAILLNSDIFLSYYVLLLSASSVLCMQIVKLIFT